MQKNPDLVEKTRSKIKSAISTLGVDNVSEATGIEPQTLKDFAGGKVHAPRGANWVAALNYVPRHEGTQRVAEIVESDYALASNWALVVQAMRSQARLVTELAEKTREAQAPVIAFLDRLAETPGGGPMSAVPVSRPLDAAVARDRETSAEGTPRKKRKSG